MVSDNPCLVHPPLRLLELPRLPQQHRKGTFHRLHRHRLQCIINPIPMSCHLWGPTEAGQREEVHCHTPHLQRPPYRQFPHLQVVQQLLQPQVRCLTKVDA